MTADSRFHKALDWAHSGLDLVFPTICAGCGKLGPMICAGCKEQFVHPTPPLCWRCGIAQTQAASSCTACQYKLPTHQVRATFYYHEPLAGIIHQMKYSGLFALAQPLAHLMAEAWPQWDYQPDLILPIPLHKRRKRNRGFNQSALIARELGQQLNFPVSESALQRIRNTTAQVGLNTQERLENVRGAFKADPDLVNGITILLIDDVYTSGATMSSAADALLASGARSVSAYCLARTGQ